MRFCGFPSVFLWTHEFLTYFVCFNYCHYYSYWYSNCTICGQWKSLKLSFRVFDGIPVSLCMKISKFILHNFPFRPEQPDLHTCLQSWVWSHKKAWTWARLLTSGWPFRTGSWRLCVNCTHHSWISSPSWKEIWIKAPLYSLH